MDGYLGGSLGHAMCRGGFGNRSAVDFCAPDEIAGAGGNGIENDIQITFCQCIGAVIVGENGRVVLERHSQPDRLATDMVDKFVVGHGMQPGGKGAGAVIGHAASMDSEQGFLHEVLRVRGKGGRETPSEIGPQMATELGQQRAIGGSVPVQCRDHQASQPRLDQSSVHRPIIRSLRRYGYRAAQNFGTPYWCSRTRDEVRGGSVCLNSYWGFAKWISSDRKSTRLNSSHVR